MTASGKEERKTWILNFGQRVEVLSAKFLKEEIKEGILKTLASTDHSEIERYTYKR